MFNKNFYLETFALFRPNTYKKNLGHGHTTVIDVYQSNLKDFILNIINFRKFMAKGSSEHWSKGFKLLTGKSHISVEPLLKYYKPVYNWLKRYIDENNVPVGW